MFLLEASFCLEKTTYDLNPRLNVYRSKGRVLQRISTSTFKSGQTLCTFGLLVKDKQ